MNYYYVAVAFMVTASMPLLCMNTEEKSMPAQSSFTSNFVNGALAGMCEIAINSPLIALQNELMLRVKTSGENAPAQALVAGSQATAQAALHSGAQGSQRLTVNHAMSHANTMNQAHKRSMIQLLKAFIQKSYKGCGTGMVSMAPITAVQNSLAIGIGQMMGENPSVEQKTIAAFAAGWLSALLASPSDLIVLQRQDKCYKDEAFAQTLRRIVAANGLSTYYRGFSGTATRDGIFTMAYKAGGDIVQKHIPINTGWKWVDTLLADWIAAAIAIPASHPAAVISARMKSDLEKRVYKTSFQTARHILAKEGLAAFFNGLSARGSRIMLAVPLLRAFTENKMGTMSYDAAVKWFNDMLK